MNIKDLQAGSYKVTSPGVGSPINGAANSAMNVNNLPSGSYQVTPPDQGNFLQKAAGVVNDVGTGIGKSVVGLVGGTEQLGEKVFNPIVHAVTGGNVDTGNIPKQLDKLATPTNTAQTVGKAVGDIAQFFFPGEGEVKAAQIGNAAIDATKLATEGGKIGEYAAQGLKLAQKSVLGAASFSGVTALQTGGNNTETRNAAIMGALFPIGGAIVGKVLGGVGEGSKSFANKLEQASQRLTPVMKEKLGAKVDQISQFLIDNKVTGNPVQRYDKVNQIYQGTEKSLQNFFDTAGKNVTVGRQGILDKLESLKANYSNDRDVLSIEKQIDDVKNLLETRWKENIPVGDLNQLKRSTYKGAYNKAGSKVLDGVEHEIGDTLREGINTATDGMTINGKSMADFNKQYGILIDARKILRTAKSRPEVGAIGRVMSKIVGAQVGGAFGAVTGGPVGFGLGEIAGGAIGDKITGLVAGTSARSKVSQILDKLSGIGKITDSAAGSIKDFIFGTAKDKPVLTPQEQAIADKITGYIDNPKVGMSIREDKAAMQNTAESVYSGLNKWMNTAKPMEIGVKTQESIDKIMKDIESGTQTSEQIRNATEYLKLKGIDIGHKVDITGAGLSPKTNPSNFKSAEDYVKAQGTPVYHGTDKIFKEFDVKKTPDGSIWFSDNLDSIKKGDSGASGTKRIIDRYINENNLKLAGWDDYDKYSLDQLQQMGYDGVKLPDNGKVDYQIFTPEKLKTKSQLTEEWNKAQKIKK